MSLVTTIQNLFVTKEDADVTFFIHDKELQAHKLIFCSRSPVFKAMITGPMAPTNQRHEINDPQVTYKDFENFFKFLYTDECDIKADNVEVLLHLSNMYDVPFLFEKCAIKLPQFFSAKTFYKFAELGLLYEDKCSILTKCLNEVPTKARYSSLQYLKQNEYVWISSELALEFVKRCPRTVTFTEGDVFQKIFDWSKGQCVLQNLAVNALNIKTIMDPFEPYIKYEKIHERILATTVYEYKLIPQERLFNCFRDYILANSKEEPGRDKINPSDYDFLSDDDGW